MGNWHFNIFLSLMMVNNLSYQGLSQDQAGNITFQNLSGLWTTVKHTVYDGEKFVEPLQSGSEIVFYENTFEWLCYPCSGYPWKIYSTLKNDTLKYHSDIGYEGLYILSFSGDTLVLHDPDGREENWTEQEYTYLLKVKGDSTILKNLIYNNVNWNCINAKWVIDGNEKIMLNGIEIPNEVEFINNQSNLFYYQDQKIYLKSNNQPVFKITDLDWWGWNETAFRGLLKLEEITEDNTTPLELSYTSYRTRVY